MSSSSPKPNNRSVMRAFSRYSAATSVTLLIVGQLAVFLVLGLTAIAHLIGIPHSVDIVFWMIAAAVSLAVAVFVFAHTLRVEGRLERGESIDNVSWALFERPGTVTAG